MKYRPGKKLIQVCGILLLLSIFSFYSSLVIWIMAVILCHTGFRCYRDYQFLKTSFASLEIERISPNTVGRDKEFKISLVLKNNNSHSLTGEIRDIIPENCHPEFMLQNFEVSAGSTHELPEITYNIPKRGQFQFGPVWIRLNSSFQLLEAQKSYSCKHKIKVLPEIFCSEEGLMKTAEAEMSLRDKLTKSRQHHIGTDFDSLSEFRQGDDFRRIDWKTTARVGYPIVRRYQIERHRDVMILIDSGRLMGAGGGQGTKLDCAVDAGLMLSRVALAGGDRCGLGIFSDKVNCYLPPVYGLPSLRSITDMAYHVQPQWTESDFGQIFSTLQLRQPKRSLIIILSDILDKETTQRFRSSLATLAKRHVVLFAALQTPLMDELIKSSVNEIQDVAQKTVTFRILHEREQAIHSIQRSGVHILDITPGQLTVNLINHFIELRSGNLL